jgi:hypothetical protein
MALPEVDIKSKHPEIDVDETMHRRGLESQLCTDVDRDMNSANPKIKRKLDADADSRCPQEVERLELGQEVGPGLEVGIQRREGQRGVKMSTAHAGFRRERRVRLTSDAETATETP